MVTMNYSSGFLGHKGMKRGAIFNSPSSFFLPKRMDCFSVVHLRRRTSGTTREKKTPLQTFIALQKPLGLMERETSTYKTIAKKRVIILS